MIKLSKSEASSLGITKERQPRKQAKTIAKEESSAAFIFMALCQRHGLPEPKSEFIFHDFRKWRFDWAWPAERIALEIDGGAWGKRNAFGEMLAAGRHTRGAGFLEDMCKMNEAAILGYKVIHCQPDDVDSGAVFELLKRAFNHEV
jgi:hypothetical protein